MGPVMLEYVRRLTTNCRLVVESLTSMGRESSRYLVIPYHKAGLGQVVLVSYNSATPLRVAECATTILVLGLGQYRATRLRTA